ncbi:MAG: hypothetical protein HQ582_34210 [Planctomycetes bacterium]|nr:hypothetical protein [Planctomycetota bacterium]
MSRSLACSVVVLLGALGHAAPGAELPGLGFQAAEEGGFYTFDTGVLRGRVRLNGKSQGITEVVHCPSETSMAAGGRLPGLMSYYRIFSGDTRFGHAARDWPTTVEVRDDGALEVFWPAADEHPLEMTALYRFRRPDTLDVTTTVKPLVDMPAFEVFLSSYYEKAFRARVYVKPDGEPDAVPRFVPIDRTPDAAGGYVMFPRDELGLRLIRDGRWTVPPSPVDWDVIRWLAAPLVMRRDESTGLAALMMSPPEDCFAISSSWNPTSPDAGGYRSLYLSFYGRDLKAGQTARARSRLVVAKGFSDEQVVKRYEEYLDEMSR